MMQAERRRTSTTTLLTPPPAATPRPFIRRPRPLVERLAWPAAIAAILFALAARLPYFLTSDFPLNDGGMFVAMSRDLMSHGFALPSVTSYNFAGIPFAYPPLAFYLVGVLSTASGLDPVVLARYVPLLLNLGTVGMVVLLARALLPLGWPVLLAPILFALVPRSYEWMIMGGGLTRSLGFLLAVAAIVSAMHLARSPSIWRTVLCSLLCGLTMATHLEEGLFALYSMGLILVLYGRSRQTMLLCCLVGLGAASLSAPWWAAVMAQHGLAPFQAASLSSGWSSPDRYLAALGQFLSTPSLVLSVLGTLAVLGMVRCVLHGAVFLPAWLAAIFVLTPRSAPSEATLPLAFLAAIGVCHVVVPGLRLADQHGYGPAVLRAVYWARDKLGRIPRGGRLASVAGLAALLALVGGLWPRLPLDPHSLDSLSRSERQAMQQVATHTPPSAAFLVLSSTWSWEADPAGEWFPVLAERHSVLTPQGAEWLPAEEHSRRVCLFRKVRDIGAKEKGIEDLEKWSSERGIAYSGIYISKAARGPIDWSTLLASATASPHYTLLLNTPEAAVLQRHEPVAPHWGESGPLVVARDCQSLAEQQPDVRRNFEARYGGRAAQAWVQEHDAELPARAGLTELVARITMPVPGLGT